MSFYQSITSSGGSYMQIRNNKPKTTRYLSSRQVASTNKKVKQSGIDYLEKDGKIQYLRRFPSKKKKKSKSKKSKKGKTNRKTRRQRRKL